MDSIKTENPWDVSTLEEFLYYCCPECPERTKDSHVFLDHAVKTHELAKVSLMTFTQDCDPDSFLNDTEDTPDLPMDETWDDDNVHEDIKPDLKVLEQQVIEEPVFKPEIDSSDDNESPSKRNRKNEKRIRCDLCKEKFLMSSG